MGGGVSFGGSFNPLRHTERGCRRKCRWFSRRGWLRPGACIFPQIIQAKLAKLFHILTRFALTQGTTQISQSRNAMKRPKKILSVDDDPLNRDILTEYLTDGGYEVIEADDGDTALKLLNDVEGIDAIVLDRMMPRLNGMEVLKAVKADAHFSEIPVIMQSAASARDQILQGIKAGVYYYLTKPYEDQMLLAIVGAALRDTATKKKLREEVSKHRRVMGLMEQSRFRFRTLEEARNIAFLIANCFPEPEATVYGLNEMLINAVEHGNLGISLTPRKRSSFLRGGYMRRSTGGWPCPPT
jgi:DNA-binding response OmpR family regulator